jgi:hypothetical protein
VGGREDAMREIQYTEALVRSAVRRAILRILGPLYFVAMLLLAVSVSIGLIGGDRGWFIGVTGTILVLGSLVPVVAIRAHTRAALLRLFKLEDGKATVDLSGGRLRLLSPLGSVDLPLSRVTNVWCYPDYWVLLSRRSILMTLPTAELPSSVADEWLAELRGAGAKVA